MEQNIDYVYYQATTTVTGQQTVTQGKYFVPFLDFFFIFLAFLFTIIFLAFWYWLIYYKGATIKVRKL